MADHQMGDVGEMHTQGNEQAGQFLVMNGTFIGKEFYFHLTGMLLITLNNQKK